MPPTSLTPPLTLLQRADLALRCMTPFVITLLLALVPVLPLHLPHETDLVPAFTLMSVFYWTVYRPDLMPASAVFAIGIIQDFAAGAPLGITSLILLGTHGVGARPAPAVRRQAVRHGVVGLHADRRGGDRGVVGVRLAARRRAAGVRTSRCCSSSPPWRCSRCSHGSSCARIAASSPACDDHAGSGASLPNRHCEERSDEAIQSSVFWIASSLRSSQ